jgi:hypothetical protein
MVSQFSEMTFQLFGGDDSTWEECHSSGNFRTPFQTANWARIKALQGWESLRIWNPQCDFGIQFLRKRIMRGLTVLWAPSVHIPPRTDFSSLTSCLLETCRPPFYARVGFAAQQNSDKQTEVGENRQKWTESGTHLGAPNTYLLEIFPNEDEQILHCSSNWKRNLARGLKREILIEFGNSINFQDLAETIKEMYLYKAFYRNDWRCNPEGLNGYFSSFSQSVITVSVRATNGAPLALRSVVVIGTRAFDMIAVTTPNGRKAYASNVALWSLINLLRKQGVNTYDLGGTDPISNPGVHNFKSGLGGQLIFNPPDIELGIPKITRFFVHTALKVRSISD